MYFSVDEQPKHAYGSHYPSHPTHGYPQPAVTVGVPGHPSEWTTGLCDCDEDCGSCCLTWWCPCITFGQIAEITDSGSTSCGVSGALYAVLAYFTGYPCCYSCLYRTKLRNKFNLEEDPCGDCLVHSFCETCALCQEYRELKNRGFDPSLGWVGNLEKRQQSASHTRFPTAPPMGQAMNK